MAWLDRAWLDRACVRAGTCKHLICMHIHNVILCTRRWFHVEFAGAHFKVYMIVWTICNASSRGRCQTTNFCFKTKLKYDWNESTSKTLNSKLTESSLLNTFAYPSTLEVDQELTLDNRIHDPTWQAAAIVCLGWHKTSAENHKYSHINTLKATNSL